MDPPKELLSEILRASAELSAAPPAQLAEALCAAVATARLAVAELQVVPDGNRMLGYTGAAMHLEFTEAALRRAWPSAWWASRRASGDWHLFDAGHVLRVAGTVAALLDDMRSALANAAVAEAADAPGRVDHHAQADDRGRPGRSPRGLPVPSHHPLLAHSPGVRGTRCLGRRRRVVRGTSPLLAATNR